MKAFAIQTIQRGKNEDGTKNVVLAGKVFDATEQELLHLTPLGAVRKPTKEELAVARWDEAEGDEVNYDAAEAVIREFADEPDQVEEALGRMNEAKGERAEERQRPTRRKTKVAEAPENSSGGGDLEL